MENFNRRLIGLALIVALLSLGSAQRAAADEMKMPDATASITLTSLAFIAGVEWGKGELNYKGKNYTFKVKGLKAGAVGIKRDSVHARVFYLKDVKDFGGTYVAGTASATIAGGGGATIMKNQNGVQMELFSVTMGADFTLGPSGLDIRLDK